jgi:hypothetical protein
MSEHDALVRIQWSLDDDVPIEGVRGIDSDYVRVRDLVKWARRRRRQLRRDIRKGLCHPPELTAPTEEPQA